MLDSNCYWSRRNKNNCNNLKQKFSNKW